MTDSTARPIPRDESQRSVPLWQPVAAGVLASFIMAALLWGALRKEVSPHSTWRLDFLSSENIAAHVSGQHEPMLLPLQLGNRTASIEFASVGQVHPRGRVRDNLAYPHVSIPWERVVEVGLYLEVMDLEMAGSARETAEINEAHLRLGDGRILGSSSARAIAGRGRLLRLKVNREIGETIVGGVESLTLEITTDSKLPLGIRVLPQVTEGGASDATHFPAGRLRADVWRDPEGTLLQRPASRAEGSRLIRAFPTGRLVLRDTGEPIRVASLLAAVWQIESGSRAIVWAFAAFAGLGGVGVFGLLSGGSSRRCALSVVALFAALGGPLTLAIPPFMGPDEVRHLLSFVRLSADTDADENAAAEASAFLRVDDAVRRVHYERIHLQTDQRISVSDLEEPEVFGMHQGFLTSQQGRDFYIQDYQWRAPLVAKLWRTFSWFVPDIHPSQQLLWLRWLTLLTCGGLIGGLVIIVGIRAETLLPALSVALLWPVFIASMSYVGNYPILYAAYTGMGLLLFHWIRTRTASRWSAFAFGAMAAVALGCGLNAWPVVGVVLGWLIVWIGTLNKPTRVPKLAGEKPPFKPSEFWVPLGVGLLTSILWVSPELLNALLPASRVPRDTPGYLLVGGFGLTLLTSLIVSWCASFAIARGLPRFAVRKIVCSVVLLVGVAGAMFAVIRGPVWVTDFEKPWRPSPMIGGGDAPLRSLAQVIDPPFHLSRREATVEVLAAWLTQQGPWLGDVILMKGFFSLIGTGDVRLPRFLTFIAGLTLLLAWLVPCLVSGKGSTYASTLWLAAAILMLILANVYWDRPLHGRYAGGGFLVFILPPAAMGWVLLSEGSKKLLENTGWISVAGLLAGFCMQSLVVVAALQRTFGGLD